MEQVKFDKAFDEFHLSIGITPERRDELIKEMHKITDEAESLVGKPIEKVNENTTGVRFDISDIIEPFRALAQNDAELLFCTFHAGAICNQIRDRIEENNKKKIREGLSEALGGLTGGSGFAEFLLKKILSTAK